MKELDYFVIFARKPYKNFDSYGNELLNYFVSKVNNITTLEKLEIVI